jgi:hypothetical protein
LAVPAIRLVVPSPRLLREHARDSFAIKVDPLITMAGDTRGKILETFAEAARLSTFGASHRRVDWECSSAATVAGTDADTILLRMADIRIA